MSLRTRIDQLLVTRGLAVSRERAQAMIMAGNVLVNDEPVTKAGHFVDTSNLIRIRGEDHPYVSRGGLKLEAALKEFGIRPTGKSALDIGSSTGGFSDCLLKHGARHIFAVDVGHNQMDWKLRTDGRITLLEGVNARYIKFTQIGQKVDIIAIDVSFISLEKIIPALLPFAHVETDWITLIKPQFEVGKGMVGKGGIVRSSKLHDEVKRNVLMQAESFGLARLGLIESPIRGQQGNKEFLAHWKKREN